MALTPARWLIDKSVLVRLDHDPVADVALPRIRAGEVGVALVTELEVGYSARSAASRSASSSAGASCATVASVVQK